MAASTSGRRPVNPGDGERISVATVRRIIADTWNDAEDTDCNSFYFAKEQMKW